MAIVYGGDEGFCVGIGEMFEGGEKFEKLSAKHRKLAYEAMLGQGIDRHLFSLYIVAHALGLKSQFLNKWASVGWGLSTSQTPSNQLQECVDYCEKYKVMAPGGGFGPVDDNGYGVSYIILPKDDVFFHVSSCKKSESTDSERFSRTIMQSLRVLKDIMS